MKKLISRMMVFTLVISMILMAASCGAAKDPAEDYRTLELSQIEAIEEAMGKAVEIGYPSAASANFELTLSDEFVNAIGIAAYLGSLRSVSFDIDYSTVENISGGKMDLLLGDTEIVSAGIVADGSGKLYITLPGYSDKALSLTLPESEVILDMYKDNIELYTDPELYACIKQLMSVALDQITDVEKIKTSLTVGDITQDCNAYTYVIDKEKTVEIATAIINELKTNQSIRVCIESTGNKLAKLTGEEIDVLTEMDKMIDEKLVELNNEAAENEADADDTVTVFLYTDNKNNVIGHEITVADEAKIFIAAAQNGQDVAAEASIAADEESISLNFDGTLVNSKITGKCGIYADIADMKELSDSNELANIIFEDYTYSLDDSVISGKITIEYGQFFKDGLTAVVQKDPQTSAILSAIANLKLVYDVNLNADTANYTIKIYAGEMEIGTLLETLTYKTDYVPTLPAADTVITEDQVNEFGTSINIMKILGNVQSCLPSETLALLFGSMQ